MLNYSYLFLTVCININTEELNSDSTETKKSDFSSGAVNRTFSMKYWNILKYNTSESECRVCLYMDLYTPRRSVCWDK